MSTLRRPGRMHELDSSPVCVAHNLDLELVDRAIIIMIALVLALAVGALPTAAAANAAISSTFVDTTYRIQREYVRHGEAKALLFNLVYHGVPNGQNETFTKESLKVIGDAGNHDVEQHMETEYAAAMQSFIKGEHHQNSATKDSLVYYLEQLDGSALDRSEEMIQDVTPNSVLEDGGTIHLYMSAPGTAALGNHTDTTDIVVLQLDGEKEWLLCKEPELDQGDKLVREAATMFSQKLDSCSSYSGLEIDSLDCERTVLRPGDALFLPRRIVHSARALSNQFSAHLTFGFNEDDFCWDHGTAEERSRDLLFKKKCFKKCDSSCDFACDDGCDQSCNSSCDKLKIFSCDRKCDAFCDRSCDLSCDSDCDCLFD